MITRFLRTWSPWAPADTIRWMVIWLVGIILWAFAWWFSAAESNFFDQTRWISLAVAAFLLVAWGEISWLMRARASVVQRELRLFDSFEQQDLAAPPSEVFLVAGNGLLHFHRSDCVLALGKEWPAISRDIAVRDGLRACGVCDP